MPSIHFAENASRSASRLDGNCGRGIDRELGRDEGSQSGSEDHGLGVTSTMSVSTLWGCGTVKVRHLPRATDSFSTVIVAIISSAIPIPTDLCA